MSTVMRVLCVLGSLSTFVFFLLKVRKEQMRIGDTVFWLTFSLGLVALGVFPQILTWFAQILGIISPVNGLFLAILFIVLVKLFSQTVRISAMNRKLERMAQEIALSRAEDSEGERSHE